MTATSRAITRWGSRSATRGSIATRSPRLGLADDEIAVATCLARIGGVARRRAEVCSLADAAQDHHIGLAIEEAYPEQASGHDPGPRVGCSPA